MRILLINHRYFVASGAERYLFNVERELNAAGHKTAPFSIAYDCNEPSEWSEFFTSPVAGADEMYHDDYSGRLSALPKSLERLFYSREVENDLLRMIDAFRPDIAYVLLFRRKLSVSVLSALKKRNIPTVARISDYAFLCEENHFLRDGRTCTKCLGGNLLPGVFHACVRESVLVSAVNAIATRWHRAGGYFDLIDKFVATNSFVVEMMVKGGFARERLACIPTFVDDQTFRPVAKPERNYIVISGRIDSSKGLETAIDAISLLNDLRSPGLLPLRIFGAPQNRAYLHALERRIEQRGVAHLVSFEGHLPAQELAPIIANAAALVIPSLWFENLPNSYLEAMSSGAPVILSNLGSLTSNVRDGRDGLLFAAGDPEALAKAITRVVTDSRLAAKLREIALDKIAAEYGAARHIDRLTSLFAKTIQSSCAPEMRSGTGRRVRTL